MNHQKINIFKKKTGTYVKQADAAHTLAEEVGANELKRLREETEKLHLNLKKQRKQYEIVKMFFSSLRKKLQKHYPSLLLHTPQC